MQDFKSVLNNCECSNKNYIEYRSDNTDDENDPLEFHNAIPKFKSNLEFQTLINKIEFPLYKIEYFSKLFDNKTIQHIYKHIKPDEFFTSNLHYLYFLYTLPYSYLPFKEKKFSDWILPQTQIISIDLKEDTKKKEKEKDNKKKGGMMGKLISAFSSLLKDPKEMAEKELKKGQINICAPSYLTKEEIDQYTNAYPVSMEVFSISKEGLTYKYDPTITDPRDINSYYILQQRFLYEKLCNYRLVTSQKDRHFFRQNLEIPLKVREPRSFLKRLMDFFVLWEPCLEGIVVNLEDEHVVLRKLNLLLASGFHKVLACQGVPLNVFIGETCEVKKKRLYIFAEVKSVNPHVNIYYNLRWRNRVVKLDGNMEFNYEYHEEIDEFTIQLAGTHVLKFMVDYDKKPTYITYVYNLPLKYSIRGVVDEINTIGNYRAASVDSFVFIRAPSHSSITIYNSIRNNSSFWAFFSMINKEIHNFNEFLDNNHSFVGIIIHNLGLSIEIINGTEEHMRFMYCKQIKIQKAKDEQEEEIIKKAFMIKTKPIFKKDVLNEEINDKEKKKRKGNFASLENKKKSIYNPNKIKSNLIKGKDDKFEVVNELDEENQDEDYKNNRNNLKSKSSHDDEKEYLSKNDKAYKYKKSTNSNNSDEENPEKVSLNKKSNSKKKKIREERSGSIEDEDSINIESRHLNKNNKADRSLESDSIKIQDNNSKEDQEEDDSIVIKNTNKSKSINKEKRRKSFQSENSGSDNDKQYSDNESIKVNKKSINYKNNDSVGIHSFSKNSKNDNSKRSKSPNRYILNQKTPKKEILNDTVNTFITNDEKFDNQTNIKPIFNQKPNNKEFLNETTNTYGYDEKSIIHPKNALNQKVNNKENLNDTVNTFMTQDEKSVILPKNALNQKISNKEHLNDTVNSFMTEDKSIILPRNALNQKIGNKEHLNDTVNTFKTEDKSIILPRNALNNKANNKEHLNDTVNNMTYDDKSIILPRNALNNKANNKEYLNDTVNNMTYDDKSIILPKNALNNKANNKEHLNDTVNNMTYDDKSIILPKSILNNKANNKEHLNDTVNNMTYDDKSFITSKNITNQKPKKKELVNESVQSNKTNEKSNINQRNYYNKEYNKEHLDETVEMNVSYDDSRVINKKNLDGSMISDDSFRIAKHDKHKKDQSYNNSRHNDTTKSIKQLGKFGSYLDNSNEDISVEEISTKKNDKIVIIDENDQESRILTEIKEKESEHYSDEESNTKNDKTKSVVTESKNTKVQLSEMDEEEIEELKNYDEFFCTKIPTSYVNNFDYRRYENFFKNYQKFVSLLHMLIKKKRLFVLFSLNFVYKIILGSYLTLNFFEVKYTTDNEIVPVYLKFDLNIIDLKPANFYKFGNKYKFYVEDVNFFNSYKGMFNNGIFFDPIYKPLPTDSIYREDFLWYYRYTLAKMMKTTNKVEILFANDFMRNAFINAQYWNEILEAYIFKCVSVTEIELKVIKSQ